MYISYVLSICCPSYMSQLYVPTMSYIYPKYSICPISILSVFHQCPNYVPWQHFLRLSSKEKGKDTENIILLVLLTGTTGSVSPILSSYTQQIILPEFDTNRSSSFCLDNNLYINNHEDKSQLQLSNHWEYWLINQPKLLFNLYKLLHN